MTGEKEIPIGIDESRIMHMLGVARRASELGKEIFEWDDKKCEEIFIMGLLHDVAYEFVCCQTEHEEYGGKLLARMGFKYWKEIYQHGTAITSFSSPELIVLNIADMQTSKDGMLITMDKRLEDIRRRYGVDSPQYCAADQLKASLESWLMEYSTST